MNEREENGRVPGRTSCDKDYMIHFLLVIEKIFSAMDWMVVSMAELFYQ